jgi:hypothetical protein
MMAFPRVSRNSGWTGSYLALGENRVRAALQEVCYVRTFANGR